MELFLKKDTPQQDKSLLLALQHPILHSGRQKKRWWLGTESNRRHMDFQSIALPTELPSHLNILTQFCTIVSPVLTLFRAS